MTGTGWHRVARLAPHPYAQTSLQLTNQLLAGGSDAYELGRLRAWIELATELFTAQVRPTGKPFISHLVGTASIVAASGCRGELVGAALLHAAYTHGDFGIGGGIVRPRDRARLRQVAGAEVEDLVDRYAARRWRSSADTISASADLHALPEVELDILRLRIANELEDLLDLGLVWSEEGRNHPLLSPQGLDAITDLARRLDMPDVGEEIVTAVNQTRSALPPVDDVSFGRPASFTVRPASLGPRPLVAAQRFFRRLDMVGGQMVGRWPAAQRLIRRARGAWESRE